MVGRIYHVGLTVSDLDRSIAFYRDILGLEFQGEIFMEGEETDKMFRRANCKARVAYLNGSKAIEAPPVELIQFVDSKIHKEQSDLFTTSISEVCFYTDDIDFVYKTLIENHVECLSEPQYLSVDDYLVYELLKKNQMETVIIDYWKRIPKESFQNWYKSQSRYRTKEDREKDALLEDATITMPEMAQLLGTTRSAVYTILDNPKYSHFFEFIVIAEKKRITKESFQKFLEGQDRYKLDPSNDYEELAQEQNIALANFRRKKLSQTGIRGSNGNIKYLTFDEASYLAKVSRSMINKWADKGKFTVIKVGSRVRILRDEFEDWMEQRDLERSMQ